MLSFLPSMAVGIISLLLFTLNTILWCAILFPVVFIKLIVPHKGIRNKFSRLLTIIAMLWIDCNSFILRIVHKINWDIQGTENLTEEKSFLVISNHISWTDIFVLQHIFKHRIPFLKFFLKKELIWVPILGMAWWALDFPFLERHSRQFLEKHPELRGKDMEATRKSCEKFKNIPVSVMNFLEGTRFDFQKHKKQNSPYRHLLLPKAGGVSLVLSSMGDYLSNVLDVTIVYPENQPPVHFWDLLSGNIPHIIAHVRSLPIPENVAGRNYEGDEAYRDQIRQWVNLIWQEKDERIDAIMKEYTVSQNKE
ncbi:MAG: acyltransferase [Calditrichaceae bacterium]